MRRLEMETPNGICRSEGGVDKVGHKMPHVPSLDEQLFVRYYLERLQRERDKSIGMHDKRAHDNW